MKDPKEFSDMSDNPTNTGWFGFDRDWDEVRLHIRRSYSPDEDDYCGEENDCSPINPSENDNPNHD